MTSLPKSDQTRAAILEAATEEFSAMGLSGARVDAIAARTTSSKRMIYHYFGSKKKLYLAVLENAYQAIREREAKLGLDELLPTEALRRLVEATFDHHEAYPNFTRLVGIENIHFGENIKRSAAIKKANTQALPLLQGILDRGFKDGSFSAETSAVDLHYMISALCIYRVARRHTFSLIVGKDIFDSSIRDRHRAMAVDAVLSIVGAKNEIVRAERS